MNSESLAFRNGTDLLIPLLADAREGDIVVPNGSHVGGWHVYRSSSGGSWVADEDKAWEGDAQTGHALHLRTADAGGDVNKFPHWHRSYFKTHFARPTVYCSFRIDDHDVTRGGSIGFKLKYLHQDNLTSYYVMLHVDGRANLYKESRDSVDADASGYVFARGRWNYEKGVRKHLVVQQRTDGTVQVLLNGEKIIEGRDKAPHMSGQIGFRLDGLDCIVHSLVVMPPEWWDMQNKGLSSWAEPTWNWALEKGIANENTEPQDLVTKEELMVFLQRYDKSV